MIGTLPKIVQDFIPTSTAHQRRQGIAMAYEYVTIHNTGNPSSNAAGERAWLVSKDNDRQASWHYCVDEKQAINAIPENEVAWHAGDGNGNGNRKSVSIEVCESGNQDIVYKNAVGLAAYLLNKKGLGIDRLKKHQDWSGKYCPRLLIPIWPQFVSDVKATLDSLNTKPTEVKGDPIMKGKVVNTDTLNIRSGPSTNNSVVGTLSAGQSVDIFAEKDGFYQIGTGKWVGVKYVEKIVEPAKTTTPPAAAPAAWKLEGINYLHEHGFLDDAAGWSAKIDENMPVWAVTTILANIAKKLGG